MRLDPQILERPPVDGVQAIVSALLDEAKDTLARMEDASDGEALHDFRVTLRRLRSTLRAFRPHLHPRLRKRHERRLRKLAGSTNAARDAAVQLAWLAEERQRVPPRGLPALDWLADRLEGRRRAAHAGGPGHLSTRFQRLARRITRRLRAGSKSRSETAKGPSFGAALADLVRAQAASLDRALDAIGGPLDVEHGHRARIEAKRLRYLLEPLRGVPTLETSAAMKSLKSLQDILGELHDAHVAGELVAAALVDASAERARRMHAAIQEGARGPALRTVFRDNLSRGLLVLDRRAVERARQAHLRLQREWPAESRAALVQAVVQVASSLAAAPVPVVRRLLLMRLPEQARLGPVQEVETGWLPGPRLRAWVRRLQDANGARFLRGGEPDSSDVEVSSDVFQSLWPATEGHRLRKRRRTLLEAGQTWYVDELVDLRRVLAEVSVTVIDDFSLPGWLEPLVVREVTGEKAYEDVRLAGRRTRAGEHFPSKEPAGTPPLPSEAAAPSERQAPVSAAPADWAGS